MEFAKRIYVIRDAETGVVVAADEDFGRLPAEWLQDGTEVAVYKYARTKRVQVTRRLVSVGPAEPGDEDETPDQA